MSAYARARVAQIMPCYLTILTTKRLSVVFRGFLGSFCHNLRTARSSTPSATAAMASGRRRAEDAVVATWRRGMLEDLRVLPPFSAPGRA